MLVSFGIIAVAARREWHEERFSALYLEQTLEGTSEASVLFADLASFTPYSERTSPTEVRRMLDAYFSRLIPRMRELGGDVHQLIGEGTRACLPDEAVVEELPPMRVKGKAEPVTAYVLHHLSG